MWNEIARDHPDRPWSAPSGPYGMTMSWEQLLFAHWPIAHDQLRSLIPAALELDTYDGQAWIGIVPFAMRNVGLRFAGRRLRTPPFLELNVRTYVTIENKPGVFFLSLDASSRTAVETARALVHLPYFHARMSLRADGDAIAYTSDRVDRRLGPGRFDGNYRPTGAVYRARPGDLDHWLTERYCLYSISRRGLLHRCEVQHQPWPLQPAEAEIRLNSVIDAHGLQLPVTRPLLHFVSRLDVVGWRPHHVLI